MEVYGFEFPEDRMYLENHVWLTECGDGLYDLGLTDLGQSLAKEIVHIDLPEPGESFKSSEIVIAFETIKAVFQITFPFDCVLEEVNDDLWDEPTLINEAPYSTVLARIGCGDVEVEGKAMNVAAAAEFYGKLIEKERERFSGYDD